MQIIEPTPAAAPIYNSVGFMSPSRTYATLQPYGANHGNYSNIPNSIPSEPGNFQQHHYESTFQNANYANYPSNSLANAISDDSFKTTVLQTLEAIATAVNVRKKPADLPAKVGLNCFYLIIIFYTYLIQGYHRGCGNR